MPINEISNFRLLLRTFVPSSFSLMISFMITLLIIGGHLILITVNGKALPVFLDEQAMQAYITTVVDPLLQITTNITFNNGLSILFWALFGWGVYAIVSFIANNVSEIRAAKQQVRFNGEVTIQSPMHRSIVWRVLWRLMVICLLVAFTLFAARFMADTFMHDYFILGSNDIWIILKYIGINLLTWMLILHGYAILLRWYALRTRVFGEIIT